MVGLLRPRFLIYGPDVEIASEMERSAEVDTVFFSSSSLLTSTSQKVITTNYAPFALNPKP